jgi:hypothetical protein
MYCAEVMLSFLRLVNLHNKGTLHRIIPLDPASIGSEDAPWLTKFLV